jgi:hypothetical protein
MNTKFTLTVIVVAILLTIAACAPTIHPLPILNMAQPVKNDKTTQLIPVTTGQSYANESTYVNQKLHSACLSENNQRQNSCQESALFTSSTFLSGSSHEDTSTYPSQQLHSACISEDSQRQSSCTQ